MVIFEQGRARGGDSIVAYNGTYTETGSDIEIQLEAFRHSHKMISFLFLAKNMSL